ncbi:hypothetical protein FNF27_06807 [Cafeteria roenbergensis]|uniref:Adenylosuccinate lyase n=1 Tax=Cafeteria roenbergensis TaxID=33653 RepID=A0A5A8CUP2_CAFRO|nr:hypothetical protein FNF28_07524 [Cafeteria roenbergensis]KAA0156164.1 hypothetical protein FNF31_05934 [Cafeteria roenbergensis]KAA0169915.1 hypothetical protein FNF27_06807 [Cafeteria roenbergensis]
MIARTGRVAARTAAAALRPAPRAGLAGAAGALDLTPLTAIGSVDGRYSRMVADLRPYFGEFALIKYRVLVEVAWLKTLANCAGVPEVPAMSADAQAALQSIVDTFGVEQATRVKEIERETNHDVKAVEYFIKEQLAAGPSELGKYYEFVHFGCTSEDVGNLAYAKSIDDAKRAVIVPQMAAVRDEVARMADQHAAVPMLARTHGQPATPTTVGKELANFSDRLSRHLGSLEAVAPCGKFNGATGSFNALMVAYPDVDWETVSRELVSDTLGLGYTRYSTQIEPHDWLADTMHASMRYNSVLLDLDRDMWGYISAGYFRQKTVAGEVGSSTMPHKVNPIAFENSEGNLGLANAIMGHLAEKLLVSRFQRDLSDSTVLRTIGTGFAHSIIAYKQTMVGLSRVDVNTEALDRALDENWEVLAEPIQTVMRRYGVAEPYEKLKALTRGKRLDAEGMRAFVRTLEAEGVPAEAVAALERLEPRTYVGAAERLARG